MTDFVNLTNGLHCCPWLAEQQPQPHYLRIQSTWCEQKLWTEVLDSVGPDFLMHLAVGAHIVVHDFSEKQRITQACWQGLVWVRFACERIWGCPERPAIMRNGHNATDYFAGQMVDLPPRTRQQVRYFRQWTDPLEPLTYELCPNQLRPR